MPRIHDHTDATDSDVEVSASSHFKSARRQAQAARVRRNTHKESRVDSRQRRRRIVVRADLRREPDTNKIARALLAIAQEELAAERGNAATEQSGE